MKIQHLIILLLIHISVITFAQPESYTSKLTISEGLSDNGVTSIFKDSHGYLWVGTYNGLNRYDGYDFDIFKNTPDKRLLPGNRIRSFAEDKNGNIWIGTEQGVCVYNHSMERIQILDAYGYQENEFFKIRDIVIDEQHEKVYCSSENKGMLVYHSNYSFDKHIKNPYAHECFKTIVIKDSIILYATSGGILSFDMHRETYTNLFEKAGKCTSIMLLNDSSILVGSANGLLLINLTESNRLQLKKAFWKDKNFTTSLKDLNGHLWLGTLRNGAWLVNDYQFFFNKEVPDLNSIGNISRVSSIIDSKSHGIWLGSFDEGIFRFASKPNTFNYISEQQVDLTGFNINNVSQIEVVDSNMVYLIGPYQNYVEFNTRNHQFKKSAASNIAETKDQAINFGFVDSKGNKWIRNGSKGLINITPDGKVLQTIKTKEYPFLDDVRAFAQDKNGNIWIACSNDVVKISFDNEGKIITATSLMQEDLFQSNAISHVNNIYADPLYNFIWVTTYYDGLFRIKLNDQTSDVLEVKKYINEFGNKQAISSNFVTAIVRLPNEQLWIGTEGGGICEVINSNGAVSFKTYTEKDGLSNNIVRSILTKDNDLWIATNNGLSRFDTENKSFRVFTAEDGLPFESYRIGAAKLNNGLMMFSGYEGLMFFKPEELMAKKELPQFSLGDLSIFNKKVHAGDTISDRVILNKRLNELSEINLKYNENVFSLEVVPFHFSDAKNYFIKYQLLPVNKQWVQQATTQRNISFNGLQPGEYVLNVKVGNRLNEWTNSKSLKITIQPPWWQKNIVRALFLLIVIAIAWFLVRMRFRFIQLNHSVEIEQMEKDKVKEVNAAKLRFFSNISHEIKTPLTLISAPVGILKERFREQTDVKEKLEIVERQSLKIAKLVDQVHDFQRSDANLLELKNQHFGFDLFINELVREFEFMANNDHKNLSIHGESGIYVYADKDKIEKVLNNLLSNAFKFTRKDDNISIDFKREGKNLIITIQDTGKGIDSEDLPHIFERFFQAKKSDNVNQVGSGIGLAFSKKLVEMHYGTINAQSKLGVGTSITVTLPIVKQEDIDEVKATEQRLLDAEKNFVSYSFLSGKQDAEHITVDDGIKGASIFIAEDNTDLRNFINDTLGKYFKVRSFENGAELLQAMEKEWPELIISDVMMPELSGFELCRQLKSDIKTSHIPIVLLTACATIEDQIKGLEDGADLYMKKPFSIQHLVSGIESLLKGREQLRKRFLLEVPLKLQSVEDDSNHAFLVKLYAIMEENLSNNDIDLDKFAEQLYLNRTFFYQKVKALTNHTPYELLKSYRIKKAADLLINEQLTVLEAFERTGFKSRPHFNKAFKEEYELTPSEYIAQFKNK